MDTIRGKFSRSAVAITHCLEAIGHNYPVAELLDAQEHENAATIEALKKDPAAQGPLWPHLLKSLNIP